MNRERLEVALTLVKASNWKLWEDTASTFFAEEFPNLRSTASNCGDGGRDGELFQTDSAPNILLQYSVTSDWDEKLRDTGRSINKNFPSTQVLIYATCRTIGARADKLKIDFRKSFNMTLDIRDSSWFLDRLNQTPSRQAASERLAKAILDPIISNDSAISAKGTALSDYETRVAYVYLELQLKDDKTDKSLTRSCFEALVKAILRHTDSDNRLQRQTIHTSAAKLFPTHSTNELNRYIDSALIQMTNKNLLKHWKQQDEFCLSFEERTKLTERLASTQHSDEDLAEEIGAALQDASNALEVKLPSNISSLIERTRRIIDLALLERGEAFASRVKEGRLACLPTDDINRLVLLDLSKHPPANKYQSPQLIGQTIQSILTSASPATLAHLRQLGNAYTAMAFLRQTPDVQQTVIKMFSGGELWLDTNIVLQLIAETLIDATESKQFTNLLKAANDAGLSLQASPGVIEELDRHFLKCLAYVRNGTQWVGSVPFLYLMFAWSGKERGGFAKWTETFRGTSRPEDDIAEYISSLHSIKRASLESEFMSASTEERTEVEEYWRNIHDRRRSADDPMSEARLAKHDAENYLGVLQRRRKEESSSTGFRTWWLTLDGAAFAAHEKLKAALPKFCSPSMSPDFLTHYLSLGPLRRMLSREAESLLPLMTDLALMQAVPNEIVELAESHRDTIRSLPDHVRRRRIRDMLDLERSRIGPLAQNGISGMERRFRRLFGV